MGMRVLTAQSNIHFHFSFSQKRYKNVLFAYKKKKKKGGDYNKLGNIVPYVYIIYGITTYLLLMCPREILYYVVVYVVQTLP